MEHKKYIFLDIDGTLYDRHSGIPTSACYAIAACRQSGHRVFLCTGRAKAEAEAEISFDFFDGAICSSGAYVEAEGRLLFSQPLAPAILRPLVSILGTVPIAFGLEGNPRSYLNANGMAMFRSIFMKGRPDMSESEILDEFERRAMSALTEYRWISAQEIYKISLFTYSAEVCEKIRGKLPLSMNFTVNYTEGNKIYNAEISNRSATKATGIDVVLNYFGASLDQTIGFGDNMNDEPMIKHCNVGVCMGNGDVRLKVVADYVCERLEEDGIMKAFQYFRLI